MIITSNDHKGIQRLKQFLHTQFDMKDLGILRYFLGIEVAYSSKGLLLTQQKYIHAVLSCAALTNPKVVPTPLEANAKLSITDGTLLNDPTRYRQVIGSLVYLTITHPDITFAVHVVSQFVAAPTTVHWAAVLRILRYLHHTITQGVVLSSSNSLSLTGYFDSDWVGDINDHRSTTGFCVFLGTSLIS